MCSTLVTTTLVLPLVYFPSIPGNSATKTARIPLFPYSVQCVLCSLCFVYYVLCPVAPTKYYPTIRSFLYNIYYTAYCYYYYCMQGFEEASLLIPPSINQSISGTHNMHAMHPWPCTYSSSMQSSCSSYFIKSILFLSSTSVTFGALDLFLWKCAYKWFRVKFWHVRGWCVQHRRNMNWIIKSNLISVKGCIHVLYYCTTQLQYIMVHWHDFYISKQEKTTKKPNEAT